MPAYGVMVIMYNERVRVRDESARKTHDCNSNRGSNLGTELESNLFGSGAELESDLSHPRSCIGSDH